jgi:hypothetical protein
MTTGTLTQCVHCVNVPVVVPVQHLNIALSTHATTTLHHRLVVNANAIDLDLAVTFVSHNLMMTVSRLHIVVTHLSSLLRPRSP